MSKAIYKLLKFAQEQETGLEAGPPWEGGESIDPAWLGPNASTINGPGAARMAPPVAAPAPAAPKVNLTPLLQAARALQARAQEPQEQTLAGRIVANVLAWQREPGGMGNQIYGDAIMNDLSAIEQGFGDNPYSPTAEVQAVRNALMQQGGLGKEVVSSRTTRNLLKVASYLQKKLAKDNIFNVDLSIAVDNLGVTTQFGEREDFTDSEIEALQKLIVLDRKAASTKNDWIYFEGKEFKTSNVYEMITKAVEKINQAAIARLKENRYTGGKWNFGQ